MSNDDFASVCASDVCERAARILVSTRELCAEAGQPLTPDQEIALGSCVLGAFMGVEDAMRMMLSAREVIDLWGEADD